MATMLRAEISQKNKYWISKHRYYELKHFCLQYPEWKKAYLELCDKSLPLSIVEASLTYNLHSDPTAQQALRNIYYSDRIKLIEKTALEADPYLHDYIIKGVTEGRSYTYLKTVMEMPCGKDMYYDRYRKFFWLLNDLRERQQIWM